MTETRRNLAAYLDRPNTPFRVAEAPIGKLGPNELLLKVHAVAINPADQGRQTLGFFVPEDGYPWILGCDGAGTVEDVGTDIKHLKVGDKVIGLSDEFWCRDTTHSMFQEYVVLSGKKVCRIPDGLAFEDACVLPLGFTTAAGMLFEKETLGLRLPAPTTDKRKSTDEVVVVWGGSSSCGASSIQLAKAAGYHIVGIARHSNFDTMERAGAEATFDYTADGMIDELCDFIGKQAWKLAGIIDAIATEPTLKGCGEIAVRLPGHKFVSTVLPRNIRPEPEVPEGVKSSNCKSSEQGSA